MKTQKILSEKVFKAGFILRKELVESPEKGDKKLYELESAYTVDLKLPNLINMVIFPLCNRDRRLR